MKMEKEIKSWLLVAVVLCLLISISSCSPMDGYKDYVDDGEISYTGKVDSLRIYSGKNRVMVKGLFTGDPKITKCKIFWNSEQDSAVVPVDRGNRVDSLQAIIDGLKEKVYNFKIYTYDSEGNASIPVYATGNVYGERYQASLINRPINTKELYAGDLTTTIEYSGMDLTSGVFATEIKYSDPDNEQHTVTVPVDSEIVELDNYKIGSDFKTRTLYMPDTTSIDTFSTVYRSMTPNIVYLKNTGDPFERSTWDGGRWGLLANWTENADVKNAGGGSYGGYELRGGTGVLSIEAGWGLPAVPNGKIYQVVTLPAGKYKFEAMGIEMGTNGTRYITVAKGNELPDVDNVPSQSYAYSEVTPEGGSSITFELTENTKMAIGFVGYAPNTGSYFKVHQVKLTKNP